MTYSATIVIPLLNQVDDWLAQCVKSALDQSVDCECIVVTDPRTNASNLNVLERLKVNTKNLKVVQARGPGLAVALNLGIELSSAARIGFLLSDDWLEKITIEKCLVHDSDIVSTGLFRYLADGRTLVESPAKKITMARYREYATLERKANYLSHFFLFRKKALTAVGGVDESIGHTGPDDFDLIWTLLENGASVEIVEECLYHYRDHDGERLTLRPREEQLRDLVKILDKHGIVGKERDQVIKMHVEWYGKPVHVVGAQMKNKLSCDSKKEMMPPKHL